MESAVQLKSRELHGTSADVIPLIEDWMMRLGPEYVKHCEGYDASSLKIL
jgi:hypothetical protein